MPAKMAPAAMQTTETPQAVTKVRGDSKVPAHPEGLADPHEQMAKAKAKLLRPMIIEAVDEAQQKSLQPIQKNLKIQAHCRN